ncbi:hypothetical protein FB567DRAFT_305807 [Paraphoma chrysanthemicola]|uniref:Uncharacterized protein n=1 Tax=Paraphoma chrysanthemicola TaxID=798071 RepID=A0A8K0R8U3_9PLEO|nr:hypothetical protein FB567DRAFT_305807 [Paraphoma chrysanthemicola]
MAASVAATVALPSLTQNGAKVALQAAEQHALEIGVPMSIAVVDAHTHLLAFTRLDGANITSIKRAIDLAATAAGDRQPTPTYQESSNLNSAIPTTSIGSGIPMFSPSNTNNILGAIACSSGSPHQDEAAAQAGRDAVLALIQKEKQDNDRRLESERQAVLNLWKEKEEEVGSLREELERGSKRMRFDEYSVRKGSICLSSAGSAHGRTPDTPPEEGEIQPSFVGEVALGREYDL